MLRFARATGDLHSLSTADIRLIALAHTLEVARHGDAALRGLPDLPSVRKGNAPAAKELPGWNEAGEKWADMDRLTEEALAEQELAGKADNCSCAWLPAWCMMLCDHAIIHGNHTQLAMYTQLA